VSLRSRDPAEATAIAALVYHEHRLTIVGDRRAFAISLDAASLGPLTLGWLSYDTEVQVVATSEMGMIFRPDRPTGFAGWRTPSQMLAVKIERHALEDELEQLLHRPVAGPIAFSLRLDLSRHGTADWSWLVSALAASLFDPDSLFRQPIMTAPLVHAILAGLLLSADHDFRAQLDAPVRRIGPTTVRRAHEYIEQHAHEPLSVSQVAA